MKRLTRPNCVPAAISLLLILSILISISYAQKEYITPEEAQSYIGEVKTVCGVVAGTKYAIKSKGQPTFLNLGQPYPHHVFTIVIWGSDRHKFKHRPEVYYKNKKVCVTGLITEYRGEPQIIIHAPDRIAVEG